MMGGGKIDDSPSPVTKSTLKKDKKKSKKSKKSKKAKEAKKTKRRIDQNDERSSDQPKMSPTEKKQANAEDQLYPHHPESVKPNQYRGLITIKPTEDTTPVYESSSWGDAFAIAASVEPLPLGDEYVRDGKTNSDVIPYGSGNVSMVSQIAQQYLEGLVSTHNVIKEDITDERISVNGDINASAKTTTRGPEGDNDTQNETKQCLKKEETDCTVVNESIPIKTSSKKKRKKEKKNKESSSSSSKRSSTGISIASDTIAIEVVNDERLSVSGDINALAELITCGSEVDNDTQNEKKQCLKKEETDCTVVNESTPIKTSSKKKRKKEKKNKESSSSSSKRSSTDISIASDTIAIEKVIDERLCVNRDYDTRNETKQCLKKEETDCTVVNESTPIKTSSKKKRKKEKKNKESSSSSSKRSSTDISIASDTIAIDSSVDNLFPFPTDPDDHCESPTGI